MKIQKFMQNNNVRLSSGNIWLVHDDEDGWLLYEHIYRARSPKIRYEGLYLEEALDIFNEILNKE